MAARPRARLLQRRIWPHRIPGRPAMVSLRHIGCIQQPAPIVGRPHHRRPLLLHLGQAGLGHLPASRRVRSHAGAFLHEAARLPPHRRRRSLGAAGAAGRGGPPAARFPGEEPRRGLTREPKRPIWFRIILNSSDRAAVKNFADLTEREVLAVAISSEEEDSRIYMSFAEDLKERYPDSAKIFEQMAEEERGHRHMLLEIYEQRFGPHLPPIRREDVRGFLRRRPVWLTKNLPLDTIRREVETMELQAERFYVKAAEQAQDVGVRRLLGDLAEAEKGHEEVAAKLTDRILSSDVRAEEDRTNRRMFVLQYVQPGLAGLMDGSVSTLAPLFAAAFATHQNWQTFLVGLAASIGAGISMGFAEALSDDGSLTGRGSPWVRGVTCGAMTALGGLGHTMPYLVPDSWANAFWIATAIAAIVVFFELWAIAYIRARYMDTPFLQAVFQIVLGGAIVLAVGILIGAA